MPLSLIRQKRVSSVFDPFCLLRMSVCMYVQAVQAAPLDARSTNLKYILQARPSKNGIFALSKTWVFWSKRVFLDFFWGHFWTSFVILVLGTSNSEYILKMWKLKYVFLEFLKKSVFCSKRVFFDLFRTCFCTVN